MRPVKKQKAFTHGRIRLQHAIDGEKNITILNISYQNNDIRRRIECSSDGNTLLLATRQLVTIGSDISHITGHHCINVLFDRARCQHLFIATWPKWFAKQNVLTYTGIQQPRRLVNVRYRCISGRKTHIFRCSKLPTGCFSE